MTTVSFRSSFVLLVCLWIPASPLAAQNRYDLKQFRDETCDFIRQPLKWQGDDWLRVGLAGVGTLLAMQADQPVRNAVMKDRRYEGSVVIKGGKLWGETYTTAIAAGAFGLHGLLANDRSSKKIGFEIVQSALYAGGITTVVKAVLGRARPYTNDGAWTYRPFSFFDDGYHSLPSGHATLAFALSTVLSRNVQGGALKAIVYIPAVLTVVSRIYQDYHWTSDCLLGALIGYAAATWVADAHNQADGAVHLSSVYPLTITINLN